MTTFILGAIAGLCVWLLFFLLRWLQPRFWPPARRQERLRIRLRKTKDELRRDRVAEEGSLGSRLSVKERRAAWAMGSPGGSCLKEGKTVVIPPLPPEEEYDERLAKVLSPPSTGGPPTTASPITDNSWAVQEAVLMSPPIPPSSPLAPTTTPTFHAAQPSESVDEPDAWKRGEKTPAQDVSETGSTEAKLC